MNVTDIHRRNRAIKAILKDGAVYHNNIHLNDESIDYIKSLTYRTLHDLTELYNINYGAYRGHPPIN